MPFPQTQYRTPLDEDEDDQFPPLAGPPPDEDGPDDYALAGIPDTAQSNEDEVDGMYVPPTPPPPDDSTVSSPGAGPGNPRDNSATMQAILYPDQATVRPGDDAQFSRPALRTASERFQYDLANPPQTKKPGIWNKLGAVAVGAAAGWNNANPRVRPVDASETIQNILYPGQARRVADWQRNVSADQAAVTNEENTAYKNAQIGELGARTKASEATAKQREAEAAGYPTKEDKASAAAAKQWDQELKILTKGRESDTAYLDASNPLVDKLQTAGYQIVPNRTKPGSVVAIPPSHLEVTDAMAPFMLGRQVGDLVPWSEVVEARKNYAKQQQELAKPVPADRHTGFTRVDPELGKKLHVVPDEKDGSYWIPNSSVGINDRIENRPTGDKPATRTQFSNVEAKKQTNLRVSQSQLQKDLANAASPDDRDTAWSNHRERAQQAQDGYEAEITALTGNPVDHFEYPSVEQMRGQVAPPPASPASAPKQATAASAPPALPQRPPSIPAQAKARYSPSMNQWQYSTDGGETWQQAPTR